MVVDMRHQSMQQASHQSAANDRQVDARLDEATYSITTSVVCTIDVVDNAHI